MYRYCYLLWLLGGLVLALAGCQTDRGPLTPANILNDFPPKVRGVSVNLEASLVTVSFQPYDGEASINGWFILPDDPAHSCRQIRFQGDIINGKDTTQGKANFVIVNYDWPNTWTGTVMSADIKYFFMITITDTTHNRMRVEVWQCENGQLQQIS